MRFDVLLYEQSELLMRRLTATADECAGVARWFVSCCDAAC
jgi:hypothetical protein